MARGPATRAEEAIQLDRDECIASAATARFAHLAMTNPKQATIHFPAFRVADNQPNIVVL